MLKELLQIMISKLVEQFMGQSKVRWVIFSSSPLKKGMIIITIIYLKAYVILSLQTPQELYVEHVVSSCNLILYWTRRMIEICFNFMTLLCQLHHWEHIVSIQQESNGKWARVQINNNTYVVHCKTPAAI